MLTHSSYSLSQGLSEPVQYCTYGKHLTASADTVFTVCSYLLESIQSMKRRVKGKGASVAGSVGAESSTVPVGSHGLVVFRVVFQTARGGRTVGQRHTGYLP